MPLIFEPYAAELANRLAAQRDCRLLELAAGTGVLTRALAATLPASATITATDLNQPMLDRAIEIGTSRPVNWRQADALALPFDDETFDVVACQFGTMFFPEKSTAFAETLRVLRAGGLFLFSVWDRIEDNEFADVVTSAMASIFPDNPPAFMARIPHGYFDNATIARDLLHGGFTNPVHFDTVAMRSVANSPMIPAIAYCQGTPLRNEIEVRNSLSVDEATEVATRALADRFGSGPIDGRIQARIVAATR